MKSEQEAALAQRRLRNAIACDGGEVRLTGQGRDMGYVKRMWAASMEPDQEPPIEVLGWIPVSARLPEPDHMGNPVGVLVHLPDGKLCIGFCDDDEYGVRWHCESTKKPTHWMPLPEPPEVK